MNFGTVLIEHVKSELPKHPSRMGKPWGNFEVQQLLEEIKSKKSLDEISKIHQRTIGGIRSRLRVIAAEKYFESNLSVDECALITGLSKEDVLESISRREYQKEKEKNKNKQLFQKETIPTIQPTKQDQESSPEMKEILETLKDIQKMMHDFLDKRYRRIIQKIE